MRASGDSLAEAFCQGARARAASRSSISDSPPLTFSTSPRATSTCLARCSLPRTTRPRTTGSSSASPARSRSGSSRDSSKIEATHHAFYEAPATTGELAAYATLDLTNEWVDHVHSFVDVVRLSASARSSPTRPTAWVASWRRWSLPGLPFDVEILYPRARRNVSQSPGRPAQPRELQRPASSRPRNGRGRRVSPSTATPTASFSSTRRPSRSAARRRRRWSPQPCLQRHPGATVLYNLICSKSVPEVIAEEGGVGGSHARGAQLHQTGRWPRPGRSSGASTPGTTTTATTTARTRGSSPPSWCWNS